jgi:hypothetical protein
VKIWVVTSSDGVTAWTTEELAKQALRRQMIAQQEGNLRDALEGQDLRVQWTLWLVDPEWPRPKQSLWELPGIYRVSDMDKHPGWWDDPVKRKDVLLAVEHRMEIEEKRVADFRERLEKLEAGHDFSKEWGYEIREWTLDTDEPQAHEDYD